MTPEELYKSIIDSSLGDERLDVVDEKKNAPAGRPFLQVYFVCANAYQRVYRSADNSRYQARCPKCGKEMGFKVGEGGTAKRMFQVSCV